MTPLFCRKKRYFSTTPMLRDRYFGFPPLHKKANKVLQGGVSLPFNRIVSCLSKGDVKHKFIFHLRKSQLSRSAQRANGLKAVGRRNMAFNFKWKYEKLQLISPRRSCSSDHTELDHCMCSLVEVDLFSAPMALKMFSG